LNKKKLVLGSLVFVASLIFGGGVFARWPARAAAGFSEFNQYLPQILVDYCASGQLIQPNDIAKDSAVETGINDIRKGNGLPVLIHAAELTQAALRHSNDMAENSFVSHTGSDGSSAGERLEEACYQWQAYGEIIAMGYETPGEVIASWMNSPAHQGVILSDLFTEFGAGYAYNPSGDNHYWTVDFGLRAAESNLVAKRYYSCTYHVGDENSESWLSLYSIWPCDMGTQVSTDFNGQR
jgi:uncharacterized protein YkwD